MIVPFPFSDLSQNKRRPALVLADSNGTDLILCMITSQNVKDQFAVALDLTDFTAGGLPVRSNIRPSRLFTANESIVLRVVGEVATTKLEEAIDAVCRIFGCRSDL